MHLMLRSFFDYIVCFSFTNQHFINVHQHFVWNQRLFDVATRETYKIQYPVNYLNVNIANAECTEKPGKTFNYFWSASKYDGNLIGVSGSESGIRSLPK